jgi:hypothetical protein
MRRLSLLTTILVVAMIPAVAGAGGGGSISLCPAYSSGTTISVLDSCFNGIAHTAPLGDTLTVSNDGEIPHTLTAVDGSFDTGQLAPIDPQQIKSDVSAAVADGNQSLAATVAGHERLLTGLVQGQTELSQKLDRLDSTPSTPIVVSVPEAEGFTLLAVAAGLGAGLALAALLALLLRRPRPQPIEVSQLPSEDREKAKIVAVNTR